MNVKNIGTSGLLWSINNAALTAVEETGGFTASINGGELPKTGYFVSDPKFGEVVPNDKWNLQWNPAFAYLEEKEAELNLQGRYFGAWLDNDTGEIYLDVNRHVDSKEDALTIAKWNNQLAIFDIAAGKEIRLES